MRHWLPTLAMALPTLAVAAPETTAVLLEQTGERITLEIEAAAALQPGTVVAVYASDPRPDPRTGEPAEGLRYAGDGRVSWVGGDLVEVILVHGEQDLLSGGTAVLGEPRRASPTPAWAPPAPPAPPPAEAPPEPEPEPAPVIEPPAEPEGEAEAEVVEPSFEGFADREREPLLSKLETIREGHQARYGDRPQAVVADLGWSDDGYGSGIGDGSLGWSWMPRKALGRVTVSLQGLRGSRYVAADRANGKEKQAGREPAVGYWLWTDLEGAATAIAPELGLAVGVQATGPAPAVRIGLRTGAPYAGHARLSFTQYGELGSQWALSGAVPLSDRFRVGTRTRVGALPRHAPPDGDSALLGQTPEWRQQRADGSLRAIWDLSSSLTLTGGAGLAGYDLLFADAGPVLDAAMELRW